MQKGLLKRSVYTLVGLVTLLGLLAQVSLNTEALAAAEVPMNWWWSDVLPLLPGSALPPLLGIAVVLATRKLLPALAAATFAAAFLVVGPNPLSAAVKFGVGYVGGAIWDPFHAAILLFTASLLGLVAVANTSGGTQGVVEAIMRFAKGQRGARTATVAMGFAVFFDDYANTAVVGPTMRPLFDRLKISREKLAYLVDSTAAPVAGLAIISTWVGTEVGYLQDAAQSVGVEASGYALFFSALGYRFYCIFALILVFAIAWSGRDFGPMLSAERRALFTGQVMRPGSRTLSGPEAQGIQSEAKPCWQNAVIPIGVVLGLIVIVIYDQGAPVDLGVLGPLSFVAWREAFITTSDMMGGNFLSYLFASSALVGSAVAILLPAVQGTLSLRAGLRAWLRGVRHTIIALVILLFAWALSSGCKDLQTAAYVGSALEGLSATAVPLVVFLVSAAVAFGTGTSWGTMAILIPTAASVAYSAGGEGVMLIAMAAVLDGAILGDHCSPISDTTVLSSICSGCDHLDHVRTQVPYAVFGGSVAGFCGYGLVAAGGAPTWLGYLIGFALIVSAVRWLAKPIDEGASASELSSAPEAVGSRG